MAYTVSLTKPATKEYRVLRGAARSAVERAIDAMEQDPFLCDIKKLKTPFEGYRVRAGDYRILFTLESRSITIYSIAHRKDAYRI